MIPLLAVHFALAAVAPLLVSRFGRRAFFVLALPSAATFVWAIAMTGAAQAAPPTEVLPWVPALGLELAFRLDVLSWLLCLVVGGVGALVLVYCAAYFDDDEVGLGRFAGSLTAFAGAMFGLVTADDLLLLYVFWELTTVLSYLLIGHRPGSRASRTAATQALVVTTFGGLVMLVGIILIGERLGTYRLSEVLVRAGELPPDAVTIAGVALLLVGAVSKSALVPFHFWLPAAMAAPTPVSAYLHAAAMVKAGVYLVARLAPAFADVPGWRLLVLVLGGATMIIGAWRSLRQTDLKLLLAYGTVSQLGFLIVLTGTGLPDAALGGAAMLLAHALFKACLFLVVGVVDHATGTRDLTRLSGLRHEMPVLAVTAVVAAASMAGLPPLLGFVAKETAFDAYLESDAAWAPWVLAVLVGGSLLTVAYSARFVYGAFRDDPTLRPTPVHRPEPLLVAVPVVLAVLTLVLGPAGGLLDGLLAPYAETVEGELHGYLALWHGFNLALALSATAWVGGAVVHVLWTRAGRGRAGATPLGRLSAEGGYRLIMRSLDRGSLEVTGFFQRGSLPLTLGLILGVFLLLPGLRVVELFLRGGLSLRPMDSWAQVITVGVMTLAAVAAVRSRRRFRAVYLVGVTGYGVALLFLLFGAPDLALTQVLVETVTIVVFILVLRRFSGRFDDEAPRAKRVMRSLFGAGVGVVATMLALVVPQARSALPASVGMARESVEYGGGDNIVNVILVDIRAWDTMGELSVVLAAATGVASLIFLEESNAARARARLKVIRDRRREAATAPVRPRWLTVPDGISRERHSVLFEVVTRLIFHIVILWSIYLLLAGHNSPGGGFAAGLVGGLALTVRYLAGGRDELRAAIPVTPAVLLGLGLFLSAGTGLVSMVFGGDVLQSWVFDIPLPLVGELHLVTSVFFDVGVYLVVLGLVLDILTSLGGAIDRQMEDEREAEQA